MSYPSLGRRAGLLLPVFSARSTLSWGIGDIADAGRLGPWLRSSGLRLLQVLPVNDMATGQTSPYSALSAMAIDPIYIAIDDIDEVRALGVAALTAAERAQPAARAPPAARPGHAAARATASPAPRRPAARRPAPTARLPAPTTARPAIGRATRAPSTSA